MIPLLTSDAGAVAPLALLRLTCTCILNDAPKDMRARMNPDIAKS